MKTKSIGHVMFVGAYEYFVREDGELYRADAADPIQTDGRRFGRWEAPAHLINMALQLAVDAYRRGCDERPV